jgi:NDP-sugar pyrophosphorylase family protein
MKAMILAAGLGTRLQPITSTRPKALAEVAGRTLLEITLQRLRSFGIGEVIVNVHHFADMVVEYLKANDHFGMKIEISREDVLLDTGGGLKKAAHFLLSSSQEVSADEPFIVHNVDVLSSIDLGAMVKFHHAHHALATLAVQHRESSRQLLFDQRFELCGRHSDGDAEAEIVRPSPQMLALAFCGIHVISPRIFARLREENIFPIVPAYLRLASEGEKIVAFRADSYYWRDLGTPASLELAAQDIAQGLEQRVPGQ